MFNSIRLESHENKSIKPDRKFKQIIEKTTDKLIESMAPLRPTDTNLMKITQKLIKIAPNLYFPHVEYH